MDERQILKRLISYVPPYWVRQAISTPDQPLIGREERIYAAVLFVDISGFTPITEALTRKGRKGIEELSAILDRYFTVMAQPVMDLGGEVVKFAGDALIVAFPAQPDGGDAHLGAALHCALRMQEAMAEFTEVHTTAGTFPLRMKIGIGEGAIYNTTVGQEGKGMQPVFAGRPLARCQEAEHHATAGEIVADAALINRMPGRLDIGEARDTFRPILGATQVPVLSPIEQPDVSALSPERARTLIQRLSPYLPRQLVERIRQGQRSVYGEHRRVTVMFVKFGGLNYDWEPTVGKVLQIYFTAMQDCILHHGGRLNEVDIGPGGGTLVVFFGAPTAHEDDELRAVSCAWEMQQAVANVRVQAGEAAQRLRQCIGISVSSGALFVGDVGATIRRTYAAIGDEVNVAARLMNLAQWGEVVVTRRIQKRASGRFDFEAMGKVQVKGKAEPVPLFALLAPRMGTTDSGVFARLMERRQVIGRGAELATLHDAQQECKNNQPQLVLICGEAGTGKSHLVGELTQEWIEEGGAAYVGNCHRRGDSTIYRPWTEILRLVFGLRQDEYAERQQEKIDSQLMLLSPELANQGAIFGDFLGISALDPASFSPEPPETDHHQALIALLHTIAKRQPLCLVLENLHDIDPLSLDLLHELLDASQDLGLLIYGLYRPGRDFSFPDQIVTVTHLTLNELSSQDSLALARKLLQDAGLSAQRAALLATQAEGNPLYLSEMVRALAESGDLDEPRAQEAIIPEGISELIQAQLDRLDEDVKLSLRIAAVIGREFEWPVLQAAHPMPIEQSELETRLKALEQAHILRQIDPRRYQFRQAMTQRVIYARLLSVDRERFHRRIGHILEKSQEADRHEYCSLLADHFYHGNDFARAVQYLLKAGQQAIHLTLYHQALAYYDRIEQILSQDNIGSAPFVNQALLKLLLSRGQLYRQLAQTAAAQSDYQRTIHIARQVADLDAQGQALLNIGEIALGQARYHDAQYFARQAMQRFSATDDLAMLTRALLVLGQVYAMQGRYKEAAKYIQQAFNLAQELDDPLDLVQCQVHQGAIESATGQLNKALDTLHRALNTGRQSSPDPSLVKGMGYMAEAFLLRGRWGQAIQLGRESIQTAQSGTPLDKASAHQTMGRVLTQIGAYEEACTHLEQAMSIFQDADWTIGQVFSLWILGEASLALGNYEQARAYFYQALVLGQKSNAVQAVVQAQLGLSKLAAIAKNWAEEQRLCTEARAAARRANLERNVIAARIGLARAYLGRKKWKSAQREALLARDGSYRLGCPYDAFRADAMLGEALLSMGAASRAYQHFEQAQTMIHRLADSVSPPYNHIFLARPYVQVVLEHARHGETK